jgi:hypothetical protein
VAPALAVAAAPRPGSRAALGQSISVVAAMDTMIKDKLASVQERALLRDPAALDVEDRKRAEDAVISWIQTKLENASHLSFKVLLVDILPFVLTILRTHQDDPSCFVVFGTRASAAFRWMQVWKTPFYCGGLKTKAAFLRWHSSPSAGLLCQQRLRPVSACSLLAVGHRVGTGLESVRSVSRP